MQEKEERGEWREKDMEMEKFFLHRAHEREEREGERERENLSLSLSLFLTVDHITWGDHIYTL